jgi:hypothetical protein
MTLRVFFSISLLLSFSLVVLPAQTTRADNSDEKEAVSPPAEEAPKFKNRHRKARDKKREAARLRKEAENQEAEESKADANTNYSSGSASLVCQDGKVIYPKDPSKIEIDRCARPIPKLKILGKGTIAAPEAQKP